MVYIEPMENTTFDKHTCLLRLTDTHTQCGRRRGKKGDTTTETQHVTCPRCTSVMNQLPS